MKLFGKNRLLFLAIIIVLLYVALINFPNLLKLVYPVKYKDIVMAYAKEYEIDPPLVAAVIRTESNFDALAESQKGARGLMQVTPATGEWIAEKLGIKSYDNDMLYDPETNIRLGCWYIKHLAGLYRGDFVLIFAAYNGGRGNVDKWLKNESLSRDGKTLEVIPFKETENFVNRIKRNYMIYRELYSWVD